MSTNDSSEDQFQLREYLGMLQYRKWSVIIVAGCVLFAGLFLSFRQTPIYRSAAKVLAKPPSNPSQFTINIAVQVDMETEKEIATSEGVLAIAAENLAGTADSNSLSGGLAVSSPANTSILIVAFASPSPIRAQAAANAIAEAYLTYKTQQAQASLEALRAPLEERLSQLTKDLQKIDHEIGNDPAVPPTLQQQARRDEINAELAVVRTQLAPLLSVVIDPGQVIQSARLPASPSSPNHMTDAILALFAGLCLGTVVALVRERLDDGLRNRADLETQSGAPVLAVIPKVDGWKKREDVRLITLREPKSTTAEAYRTLRTSMLFVAAQRGVKTILITSPGAGEGKTTTAANLAVVLSNADKRVILLNADLRKPRVHKYFQVPNKVGVVNVLAGEVKPWEALVDPGIENLRIFPSGPIPTRPAELLGSEAMGELLAELRQVADFIIIDSAPCLVVSDALALAPLCDAVLFVADAEGTTRGAVAHAREQLEQGGAEIIGSILNNFDPAKSRMGRYYYGYRYNYRYRYRYGHDYGTPYGLPAETDEEDEPRQGRSSI